ncbi:MAG: DUF2162 domain-containing protein [Candidatus Desantisbacteria bacterium]
MDINITLWIVGILFTLSILAIKLGFGLGFSGLRWQGICGILFSYLTLFILIAIFSSQLIKFLEPVLRKGPYLHAGMALGMIIWGMYILIRQSAVGNWQPKASIQKAEHSPLIKGVRGLSPRRETVGSRQKSECNLHALWLIIPCPVCLTAITFCTWAALGVIKLPALIVGLGMGGSFVLLSLLFLTLARVSRKSTNPRISLGLCMIAIGGYFLASLILPAKIEEARGVYHSFLVEGNGMALNDSVGVFMVLLLAALIGFFKQRGITR